ncbi:MAG: S1 family peptidase, partial [Caldilineales bacterium]|nr:S1 family peptidase [Caldilineales bacterium]
MRRRLVAFLVLALLSSLSAPSALLAATSAARPQPSGPAPLDRVPVIAMPPVDNAALVREEVQRAGPGVAPRFALPIPVDLSPANSGRWETLADGTRLWRLRLRSAGALSLNLGFDRYVMPDGGQLLLYTPDGSAVRGPFTAADNEAHGQLWTPLLEGEEIVVEVRVPAEAAPKLELHLASVNHGFLPFGQLPTSGACNVDVVCGAADGYPQVDAWRDQIRAVAAISTGGSIFCTGFLVNNTAQDLKPYFMTARHCGVSSSNAPSLVTYWNYQNSFCRPPGSPASGAPGNGSLSQFNTGSYWRAGYSPSDFTLVELDDPINPAYNVHWAGWDATPADATSAVGIHHPNGEEKRISFENQPTTTTSYLGTSVPGDGTHVRVIDWDLGTTEPGSSGSPLFNQDRRVIGQLHGGYAACGNDDSDWYGRFSVSWNGGGTPSTRLKDWLDPLNSGVLVLDGRDQSPDFTLTASPTAQDVCVPANAQYTVTVTSRTGFADPVTLSASGNPGTASFSPNPVTPPPNGSANSTLTVSGFGPGAFTFAVVGTAGSLTRQTDVTLRAYSAAPGSVSLLSPADGSVGVAMAPTLSWSAAAQAATYQLQVATDPGFANVVINQSGL